MLPHSFFSRPGLLEKVANSSEDGTHAVELAGLGTLAVPSALQLAGKTGVKSLAHGATTGGRVGAAGRFLAHGHGEQLAEIGGLGVLAGPSIQHFAHKMMHRGAQKEGSLPLSAAQMYYFFDELVG